MAKTSPYKPGMPWVSVAVLVFLVLIVVGASVFESTRLRTDGPMMAVTANGNMFSVFGNDTVKIPVAKGDSVKMLGVHGDGIFMDYLVETPAGVRGWIKPWYVDMPVLTHSKKVNPGDTIRLTNIPKTESKYGHILGWEFFGTLADGSRSGNIYPTDYFPAFKDSYKFILRKHSSSHFASRAKFERTVVGKNIDAVEKEYGPILQNFPADSVREVTVNTSVFDKNSGLFYQPILTVAPDSTVSAVRMGLSTDRNSWIWKYLPLSSQLIDLPLTSFLARGDLYDSLKPSEFCDSALEKTWNWIKRIAIGIGGLLWLFAVPAAVVLFFYILLYFRHVLYPLSDTAVKILIAVVTILFAYYWIIMTMTWGEYLFWEILLIASTYLVCQAMCIPLADEIPHVRCQKCRAMEAMELVDKDFLESEEKTEDTSTSHQLGSRTRRWQTWTQVTKGNSSWRENVKNHYERDTDWRRDHYKEKVRYDRYMLHYQCQCCGHKERKRDYVRVVLDKKYQGSSTYTTHSSSD